MLVVIRKIQKLIMFLYKAQTSVKTQITGKRSPYRQSIPLDCLSQSTLYVAT